MPNPAATRDKSPRPPDAFKRRFRNNGSAPTQSPKTKFSARLGAGYSSQHCVGDLSCSSSHAVNTSAHLCTKGPPAPTRNPPGARAGTKPSLVSQNRPRPEPCRAPVDPIDFPQKVNPKTWFPARGPMAPQAPSGHRRQVSQATSQHFSIDSENVTGDPHSCRHALLPLCRPEPTTVRTVLGPSGPDRLVLKKKETSIPNMVFSTGAHGPTSWRRRWIPRWSELSPWIQNNF